MATLRADAPDPGTFKSWEDAFEYPIPSVRRMEQQVRSELSSNRERLRNLVGASYRDLLGTAESIMLMDGEMHQVESYLGDMSKRCNSRLLEKSVTNAKLLNSRSQQSGQANYAHASRLSLLRHCPEVLRRILRKNGSVLLAAKVLVLSRLLVNKLSSDRVALDYVGNLKMRLGRIRQKLLAIIDLRLGSLDTGVNDLVDSMCAYALATSSSSNAILRQFHSVRSDSIERNLRTSDSEEVDPLRSLGVWFRTLHDTHVIFLKQLPSSLARLVANPILKDPGIQSISEFDLDVHESWIGEEIRNFTPYVQFDNLSSGSVATYLSSWAATHLKVVLQGVAEFKRHTKNPKSITGMHYACMRMWFLNYSKILGISKSEVFNKLRQVFLERMIGLTQRRCEGLRKYKSYIQKEVTTWTSDHEEDYISDLWMSAVVQMNPSLDTDNYTRVLQATYQGRTAKVDQALVRWKAWIERVGELRTAITELKDIDWDELEDEIVEDDEDDDDSNRDEDDGASAGDGAYDASTFRRRMLAEKDPRRLLEQLDTSTTKSLQLLYSALSGIATALTSGQNSRFLEGQESAVAMFLLRIVREIRASTKSLSSASTSSLRAVAGSREFFQEQDITIDTITNTTKISDPAAVPRGGFSASRAFPFDLDPVLHRVIAVPIVGSVLSQYRRSIRESSSSVPGLELWDGGGTDTAALSALPTLPSPWAFGVLRALVTGLGRAGADVWTPVGIVEVKTILRRELARELIATTEPEDENDDDKMEGSEGGHGGQDSGDLREEGEALDGKDQKRTAMIQRLFDLHYLGAASRRSGKSRQVGTENHDNGDNGDDDDDELCQLRSRISDGLKLESPLEERITKAAQEYWGRTSLLFGLLAT